MAQLFWLLTDLSVFKQNRGMIHGARHNLAFVLLIQRAAVAEWLSSWLAEQEDRGSIPGLATWIFRDWLSPASKSRYGWKIAKSTLIRKTTNQPTNVLLIQYTSNSNKNNKGTIELNFCVINIQYAIHICGIEYELNS